MNRTQKVVVWLWLCLMALCTLFPPWVRIGQPMGEGEFVDRVYVGHGFLFKPPELSESFRSRRAKHWDDLDEEAKKAMEQQWMRESRAYHVIEVGRLIASWMLISLVGFAVIFATWRPQRLATH